MWSILGSQPKNRPDIEVCLHSASFSTPQARLNLEIKRPALKPRFRERFHQFHGQHGKLEGPAQLAAACNSINNTTGVVLKRSGRKIKQYMTVKGIKLYFSFKLPNNGKRFGDAGYLHARYMTESGDWVILPAGTSQTRQSRE